MECLSPGPQKGAASSQRSNGRLAIFTIESHSKLARAGDVFWIIFLCSLSFYLLQYWLFSLKEKKKPTVSWNKSLIHNILNPVIY
jgi:hypothetical protein